MTVREKEILSYIIAFKLTNGYSPTTKEIMLGINTKSKQFVETALENLQSDGYITTKPRCPRTINVIKFF